MCLLWAKMRTQNYVATYMRMLKVSSGRLKQTCDTRVIHYNYYARAALAWTKKKRSLRNEKLKARKEMLRIRRENKKTENHE